MTDQTALVQPASAAALGRYLDSTGQPIDDGPPLAHPLPELLDRPERTVGSAPHQLETGIKVLDLFAPIVRGGIMSFVAGAGVGKTVLMEELIQRVATRQGGCAVLASLDGDGFNKQDVIAELRGGGVERYVATVLGRRDEPAGTTERIARLGLALAEDLSAHGREVLLFIDELLVTPATIERILARQGGGGGLTIFVLQHNTTADQAPSGALARLLRDGDGRIVFSKSLARQNIWPAVDPLESSSRLLDQHPVSAEHERVATAARDLLRRTGVIDGGGNTAEAYYGRARRTLLFCGQPFVVAEPYTAVPGAYVPLDVTIRNYGELVAGQHDHRPEEDLRFIGAIE